MFPKADFRSDGNAFPLPSQKCSESSLPLFECKKGHVPPNLELHVEERVLQKFPRLGGGAD